MGGALLALLDIRKHTIKLLESDQYGLVYGVVDKPVMNPEVDLSTQQNVLYSRSWHFNSMGVNKGFFFK